MAPKLLIAPGIWIVIPKKAGGPSKPPQYSVSFDDTQQLEHYFPQLS